MKDTARIKEPHSDSFGKEIVEKETHVLVTRSTALPPSSFPPPRMVNTDSARGPL